MLLIASLVLWLVLRNRHKKPAEAPVHEAEVEKILYENYYYADGKLHFIDKQKNEIGEPYECKNKDEKLCYVAINNYRDDFDISKILDENGNAKTERMPIFEKDYVFIFDNENPDSGRIPFTNTDLKTSKDSYTKRSDI